MRKLSILHTNDIHGNVRSIARVATLKQQLQQQQPEIPVLYVDAGDCLDKRAPLSKATHGVAMYELLAMAGCEVSVLGNKCMKRWGMEIVAAYAAQVPVLVANLQMSDGSPIPGTTASIVLNIGGIRLGFLGVTAYDPGYVAYHQLQIQPLLSTIHGHLRILRETHRAEAVILLSHLGVYDDYRLARAFRGQIELIIGAHSHSLLPNGTDVGGVSIAQAGSYGRFVGQIDIAVEEHLIVKRMVVHPLRDNIKEDATITARISELETTLKQQ